MPVTLDSALHQFNRESEEHAAQEMANSLGLSYATLDDYPFNLEVLSLIPLETVKQKQYAAYIRSTSRVRIAIVHPEDQAILEDIQTVSKTWPGAVELTVVSPTSFKFLIQSYAHLIEEKKENDRIYSMQRNEEDRKNYFVHIRTLDDLRNEIGKASTTELIDVILAAAYNQKASDIHIEPAQEGVIVRFRIDGVLQKVLTLPSGQQHHLLSRIKLLSNMKLDIQQAPQDGRFSLQDKGINADLRVATIPTGYGEAVVMRILRQDMQALSIQELGFSEYNQSLIEKVVRKPYGLILVTGPTGSGKSTTLYALLKGLNSPEKKIITLEDPIEYRLDGIQQSQIDPEKGFTFAEGLKGALRQDPDIVMVGEIRDPETATIALNASLTGHLVLSTLHTNNAVTAHTRFLEMGIPPFLLTGSIQMVVAQRLIRKVVSGESTPEQPEYKGRIVIGEVLCPSPEFEQAVIAHADQSKLEELAVKGGMVPMLQDGMEKVKAGLTTEQEIYRVTMV